MGHLQKQQQYLITLELALIILKYVLDDSEIKHNKFIPETNIQIKSKDSINVNNYDYILVLAWNFFDSIVKSNKSEFQK